MHITIQSTDPHIRRYDRQDDWTPCPQCRSWLLPLAKYEIQKSGEGPTVSAEVGEFLLYGWWIFVYNFVNDFFTFESRKKRLDQLKRETLPHAPNSLVCPKCLHVVRKG